jgi:hypothetical protein
LNHVPHGAKIKDGTIGYEHSSISRSSENKTDGDERTQNIIHSRFDHLKGSVKREMTNKFYSEQNARAPKYGNIANGDLKSVQF